MCASRAHDKGNTPRKKWLADPQNRKIWRYNKSPAMCDSKMVWRADSPFLTSCLCYDLSLFTGMFDGIHPNPGHQHVWWDPLPPPVTSIIDGMFDGIHPTHGHRYVWCDSPHPRSPLCLMGSTPPPVTALFDGIHPTPCHRYVWWDPAHPWSPVCLMGSTPPPVTVTFDGIHPTPGHRYVWWDPPTLVIGMFGGIHPTSSHRYVWWDPPHPQSPVCLMGSTPPPVTGMFDGIHPTPGHWYVWWDSIIELLNPWFAGLHVWSWISKVFGMISQSFKVLCDYGTKQLLYNSHCVHNFNGYDVITKY